jgi:hypothetical protein
MGLFKKIVKGVLTGGASVIAEKAKKSTVGKAVLSGGASLIVDKVRAKKTVNQVKPMVKSAIPRPVNPLIPVKPLYSVTEGAITPSVSPVVSLGSVNSTGSMAMEVIKPESQILPGSGLPDQGTRPGLSPFMWVVLVAGIFGVLYFIFKR